MDQTPYDPAQRPSWSAIRTDLSDLGPGQRRALVGALVTLGLLAVLGLTAIGYVWRLSSQFPEAPFKQPSRLYARSTELAVGRAASLEALAEELAAQGYLEEKDGRDSKDGKDEKKEEEAPGPLSQGSFRRSTGAFAVHLRPFATPEGRGGGVLVEAELGPADRDGYSKVERLRVDGRVARQVALEPPLLASYYGPDVEERRPVTLEELPEEVVRAILAAEDDGFYAHPGLSPAGIARAAWANLRGGEVTQGGSTVTQQLVKNLYLSPERTLVRKAREAVLALAIELRYGKDKILEAYLNEIYWGTSGKANVIGLGAAARAYFGKDASVLSLAEAATLGGMIRAPADYSPIDHADAAKERRDWVLRRMAELGWAEPVRVEAAVAAPLGAAPHPVVARREPYLSDAVAAEARERFDLDELADEGYLLYSTVSWREQRAAERAVAETIEKLEASWEKRRRGKGKEPLQAALLSVDPRDGAVRAWVGGRDYALSQFDRVSQARRQAGSTVKPVIFAAAFAEDVAYPSTALKDSPITVKASGQSWRPQNDDRRFRGWVTARTALEQSLNIPTVRLALQVGLTRVVGLARDMGISEPLEPVPSLALGAFEVTPYDLAEVYSTFASGGTRPTLHAVAAVYERSGEQVLGDDLPAPRRVLHPQSAYLVTSLLQGAVDHGTGAGARRQGVRGNLAGKTGTTNGRRDSWFAGYSPDLVTVVWVGYDDNRKTNLSGSRAALPLWSRFTRAVRPPGGYAEFTPPPGITTATVDPTTGELATEHCPYVMTEVFPEWRVPRDPCRRHSPGASGWVSAGLYDPYGTYDQYGETGEETDDLLPAEEQPWPEGDEPELGVPLSDFEEWAGTEETEGGGTIEIRRSDSEPEPPVLDFEPVELPEMDEEDPPPPPPW